MDADSHMYWALVAAVHHTDGKVDWDKITVLDIARHAQRDFRRQLETYNTTFNPCKGSPQ